MKSFIKQIIFMTLITAGVTAFSQSQTKKALLVIDVQENLLNPKSKWHMVPDEVEPLLDNLNKSIQYFKENNSPIIYTINEWTNPFLNAISGNVCKKGTKGVGIDPGVTIASDMVYHKSVMNALSDKKLLEFLRKEKIEELYLTGLFAEACVKSTFKASHKNGFKTIVIEDAVGSRSAKNKLRALNTCKKKGARIIQAQVLRSLK